MNKLHALEAFCLVCDKKNFASAARQLNISATMVGRYVKNLESELGCLLLMRNTRKVTITEAGQKYYSQVKPLLKKLNLLDQSMVEYNEQPKGKLVISTSVEFGGQYFAPLMQIYRAKYPEVRLDIQLTNSPIDLLDENVDLVFRIAPELPDSSYIARSISKTRLALWASPEYLSLNGTPHSLDDLHNHQLLFFSHSVRSDQWIFKVKKEIKKSKFPWAYQSNNGRLLNEAAANSQGIIQAPYYSVREYVENKQLVELLPLFSINSLGIYALYPHRCELSINVKTFIEEAQQHFKQIDLAGKGKY
ncbi:MAG: LysR family transcriptional regulator [Kangiellaceae bacterium]|nr:LysR family transcriptional regulator [Kangiellaceae bacterium]MCW9017059.1 LysR family transcriptional regulator [Kangiellaceae bacterium]